MSSRAWDLGGAAAGVRQVASAGRSQNAKVVLRRRAGCVIMAAMRRTPVRYMLSISVSALIVGASLTAALASTAPGLGAATSFAVLAHTTVTNDPGFPTLISGDLGVSPGTAVTGFPPGTIVNGTEHSADLLASSAQNDLTTAYNIAASSPCNFNKTNQNLGGLTLTPGTYCQTTAPTLTGTLTLSGNGIFIFQIGSTLVTGPGATVSLTNGAQPCNVFWQVGSSATLDTTTTFVGTIMASASISLNNGATIAGRALTQTGQVSLINNQITAPTTCNAATVSGPTATVSGPTATPTPTPTPAVPGIPRAGTGPSQGDGFPWILAMVTGVLASAGAAGLGISVRTRRSSRQ